MQMRAEHPAASGSMRCVRWLRIGFGVLALWLAGVAAGAAQPVDSLRQVLVDALARGDAARLLEQAPSQVELALLGKGQLYSRMQARYVLMDFFQAYPPLRVELDEDRLLGAPSVSGRTLLVCTGGRALSGVHAATS